MEQQNNIQHIKNIDELLDIDESNLSGFYYISDEIYFDKRCPGITRSMLNNFSISPKFYKMMQMTDESTDSKALAFGRAFHLAMEDWDKFELTYDIPPDFVGKKGNTKADQLKQWTIDNNKLPIEYEDKVKINIMTDQIKKNELYLDYFKNPVKEVTIFSRDKNTGLLLRGKIDVMSFYDDNIILGDYKSCQPLSISIDHKIQSEILHGKSRYYYQSAFYKYLLSLHGYNSKFIFIFIEKELPFGMRLVSLDDDFHNYGLEKIYTELDDLNQCERLKIWPDYEPELLLTLPKYIK